MQNDPAEEHNLIGRPDHCQLVAQLKLKALAGWDPAGKKAGKKKAGPSLQRKNAAPAK